MTLEEQFAYCAGLLDGEGCFHASRNDHCNTVRYGITVNMTQAKPLERLRGLFGGEIKLAERSNNDWADIFSWTAPRKSLVRILESVSPYLIGKRRQAGLLREMRVSFLQYRGNRHYPVSEEVVSYRQFLTDEIGRLKHDYSPVPIPKMSKLAGWAYTAGILDSEGCIGIYHGAGRRIFPKVQIGMRDPNSIDFIFSLFEGMKQVAFTQGAKNYRLVLEHGFALEICKKTHAYRLLKLEQGTLVITLQNHRILWEQRRQRNPLHGLPDEVIATRERWYRRCRFLNSQSGRAETNSNQATVPSDSPNRIEPQDAEAAEMTARCDKPQSLK